MGILTLVDIIASEYLRMLYKINEIYSRYNLGDEDMDLSEDIKYYSSKNSYDDSEIQGLIEKCNSEWKNLLIKICENLIIKVESENEYLNLLRIELKQVKQIYAIIKKEKKLPDEYEKIFDEELDELKDRVEVKFSEKDFDKRLYKKGLFYGGIIGLFIALIVGILLYYLIKYWIEAV